MTAQALVNPLPQFFGRDGFPLSDGSVYFGQPNQDPRQYPKAVYFDEALVTLASQPVRTQVGYLYRNGSATNVWADGSCSVLVLDRSGQQVYYVADWSGVIANVVAAATAGAAAQAVIATTQAGIATTQAGLATTAKTGAETAKTAAEAAMATAAASAKIYPSYALGVAGTVDGDYFSVYSSDLAVRYIYKRVSSQGELQAVRPYFNQFEAEIARKLASTQTFDAAITLPAGARVDLVAAEAMFGVDQLKNRAYTAAVPDLNLYGRSRPTEFPAGSFEGFGNTTPTLTLGVAGEDSALKAIRAVYAGSGVVVLGLAPTSSAGKNIWVPAGRWTVKYRAMSNSGSSAAIRMHGNGAAGTYGNVTVATTWTDCAQTFVQSADGLVQLQLVREASAPSAFDITIDNIRLVPGSTGGSASATNEHLLSPQGANVMQGMVVKSASNSDTGARMIIPLTAPAAFTGVTVITAVRREGAGANNNFIASDNSSSASGFYLRDNCVGSAFVPGLDAGLNAADTDMVGLPLNDWIIVGSAAGPDGSSMYVNSVKVTQANAAAYTGFTTDFFSLNGLAARQDANFIGKNASTVIYGRRLTDAEMLRAISVMKTRIAALGERFTDFGSFYVAEGDSITYGTGATAQRGYAKLLGQRFTPYLQGIDYGVAGNTLANLTARAATVDAKIAEAIALGKRVIFSVLIGANELPASNAAADTYYASLKTYWAARRATGAKVIAGTVIGASGLTGGQISALAYLNGLIRGDASQYDGLADYANNANLGTWNGTYFADTQHPNDTGHALMETILRPIVTGLWLP